MTALLEEFRQHPLGERLEGFAVAEERRHRNEQVAEQRLRLVRVVAQILVVLFQVMGSGDLHAAGDPPQHGRALVFRKIMTGAHAQQREDALQFLFVRFLQQAGNRHRLLDAQQIGKPHGEFTHRQHEIRWTGGDGAARHRGIFGLVRVLHQDDAAGFLDGAHADGAVRTGAAQNDGEAVAEPFGERTKE